MATTKPTVYLKGFDFYAKVVFMVFTKWAFDIHPPSGYIFATGPIFNVIFI